ncbi:MAG: porin family protein [Bacteroidia bacterium]
MKKILLVISLIASGLAVNAQSFNIGLGGGIYSTWLVNKNVSDQGDDLDFAVTFGGQIGPNMNYYFNDKIGLSLGLLFTGHNQKYTGDLSPTESFEAKTKLRYLDIPFLVRFGGGGKGAYFEFGPQMSILLSASEDLESTPANSYLFLDHEGKDVKKNFSSSGFAAMMGFGVDIDASEQITVTTGLRLGYGFTDATQEYTQPEAEILYFADQLALSSYYAHIDDDSNFKYKSTNRAFGGLFLSVTYKIPAGGSKSTAVPDTK